MEGYVEEEEDDKKGSSQRPTGPGFAEGQKVDWKMRGPYILTLRVNTSII